MDELAQFRAALIAEYEKDKKTTYSALGRKYGVNQKYLREIINTPGYEPPASVCAKLGIAKYQPAPVCVNSDCEGYGEPHVYDCRTQTVKAKGRPREYKDLFAMPKGVLLWKLENRS